MNMKRFLAALLVGTVCAAAQAQIYTSEDGFLHVDLKKAIDIALDENPTIRIAEKDIELKKIADKEAWQALLPEISVTGTLQHTLLAAEMKLGGNSFKMGQDNTNTVNVAAALNVPLFAPAVYQNMKLTKEDIRKADIKERLTTPSSWVSGAVLRKNAVRISLCSDSNSDIKIMTYDALRLYKKII